MTTALTTAHQLAREERKGVEHMTTKQERIERIERMDRPHVTGKELDAQQVTMLPAREELSLVNANIAAPINAALALNVLSDGAVAYANAQQTAPIVQGI
jgi:hypothetical protein